MKTPGKRILWYRSPRVRAIIFQLSLIALLVFLLSTIAHNTIYNMNQRGIKVGIDFMWQVAPFEIAFSPFWNYQLGSSRYWEVLVIGIQNTILVSLLGIISATVLGFIIGVLRLSSNYLVARLAAIYVEIFRNIPLPLWIFFWATAVFLPVLPPLKKSFSLGDGIFLNKEGIYIPRPVIDNMMGFMALAAILLALIIAIGYLAHWNKQRQALTGKTIPVFYLSLIALITVPVAGFYITGTPVHLEYPMMGRFVLEGGINLYFPFFVMWFALTVYTAAYIGENVRGGIKAVSTGQFEAGDSLGLDRLSILRLIIIPQAMRVIIPPTISQFLNLTKNSSLAVIVAYEDIVALFAGVTLNNTGQALPIIAITIAVYAVLSLLTSWLLNWYNAQVQLTQR